MSVTSRLFVALGLLAVGCGDPDAREGTPSPTATEASTASPSASMSPTFEPSQTPETPTATAEETPEPTPTEEPTPEAWPVDEDSMEGSWGGVFDNGQEVITLTLNYYPRPFERIRQSGGVTDITVASNWYVLDGDIYYQDLRKEGEPEGTGQEAIETGCRFYPTEPLSFQCAESVWRFYRLD